MTRDKFSCFAILPTPTGAARAIWAVCVRRHQVGGLWLWGYGAMWGYDYEAELVSASTMANSHSDFKLVETFKLNIKPNMQLGEIKANLLAKFKNRPRHIYLITMCRGTTEICVAWVGGCVCASANGYHDTL